MAMLLRSLKARLINRGARNYRSYADLAVAYEERVWDSNGTAQPRDPDAERPGRRDHARGTRRSCSRPGRRRPALAAGSTMILKPAEWSPLSCSLLADLVDEAGFPPGVFNVVQGIGEEIGAALVSHPDVRRISFTGSPETARHIGVAAAQNIVPFTGELGGKGPLLVFADCDLEAAARKAAGQFDDAGQVCLAGTRILVQESVAEPFLELFHRFADEHVLGDPRDDDTTVTPLIHREHFDRVAALRRARPGERRRDRPRRPSGRAGRPLLRADARRAALERERDRPARGVRAGAYGPDLLRRGRGRRARQLDRLRALGDRLHGLGGAGRARRPRDPRRHGLGQHVPRPRPDGAVRRDRDLRHRPRGRRLRARLLLRPEDAPDRRRHDGGAGSGLPRSIPRTLGHATSGDRRGTWKT